MGKAAEGQQVILQHTQSFYHITTLHAAHAGPPERHDIHLYSGKEGKTSTGMWLHN